MLGGLRGDLSSLSRAEVQGLAAGQRDAQRFVGLIGDALHRCLGHSSSSGALPLALSRNRRRLAVAVLLGLRLGRALGPGGVLLRSGRAASPSVTCRPWFPPFGRLHGNASVKRRSGQVGSMLRRIESGHALLILILSGAKGKDG